MHNQHIDFSINLFSESLLFSEKFWFEGATALTSLSMVAALAAFILVCCSNREETHFFSKGAIE